MTASQRITLMADWWPKACRAQGWKAGDRTLRMRALSEAVHRKLVSANDLNSTTDIDAVKAHLAALADNLPPVVKHETPDEDEAVRWRWLVREEIRKLAELIDGAHDYAASIIRDKFQHGAPHSVFGVPASAGVRPLTIDDLSLWQLKQLKFTLDRAVKAKKGTVLKREVATKKEEADCPF